MVPEPVVVPVVPVVVPLVVPIVVPLVVVPPEPDIVPDPDMVPEAVPVPAFVDEVVPPEVESEPVLVLVHAVPATIAPATSSDMTFFIALFFVQFVLTCIRTNNEAVNEFIPEEILNLCWQQGITTRETALKAYGPSLRAPCQKRWRGWIPPRPCRCCQRYWSPPSGWRHLRYWCLCLWWDWCLSALGCKRNSCRGTGEARRRKVISWSEQLMVMPERTVPFTTKKPARAGFFVVNGWLIDSLVIPVYQLRVHGYAAPAAL